MLPKGNRVKKDFFTTVLNKNKGRSIFGEVASVRIIPSLKTEASFSFIVSKKTANSAVDRNLIKRRFSAIIEESINKIPPNRVYLFYIKKPAVKMKFSELKKEILNLINKIK